MSRHRTKPRKLRTGQEAKAMKNVVELPNDEEPFDPWDALPKQTKTRVISKSPRASGSVGDSKRGNPQHRLTLNYSALESLGIESWKYAEIAGEVDGSMIALRQAETTINAYSLSGNKGGRSRCGKTIAWCPIGDDSPRVLDGAEYSFYRVGGTVILELIE